MQQQPQPRSQSVSRMELYSQQPPHPARQVSFRSSPPGAAAAAAPPRRSQSSMRALATPRHYPLSMPNHTSNRAQSTGRATSEPGTAAAAASSFTLDYDDPEEVTRAILRLREQRERDAAERSASRTRHRTKATRDVVTVQRQQPQQRQPVVEPTTKQSSGVPSNAVRQQQLQQLQQAMAIQKSHSQGSSTATPSHHHGHQSSDQQQNHAAAAAVKLYRSPSPSLAQRRETSNHHAPGLSLQRSGSSEHRLSSRQQPHGTAVDGSNYRPTSTMRGQQQQQPTAHRIGAQSQQLPTPRIVNGQQPPPPPPPLQANRASPSPHLRHQQLQPPAAQRMVDPNGDGPEPRATANGGGNGNLKQAEQRIDGLLAELEELKFFHELDGDGQSPPTKVLGAMRPTTPTSSSSNPQLRVPQMIGVPAIITSGSDGKLGSSASNNKLPPPPVNFMDPREISRLDRHTLELEAQKMIRSVQLLTSEKLAIEAEMEVLTTDQAQNKNRIQQLEQTLTQVKQQLIHAKKEMDALRTTMTKQYEGKLSENVEKLQQTQKQVDGLKDERESLQADLDKRTHQLSELKHRSKTELREEQKSAQEREAVLELQLAEVISTVESLKLKMKEKDDEIEDLRQQVHDARQAIATVRKQEEVAHQAQLQSLHEQLAMTESKYKRAVEEREQVQQQLDLQEKQLESVRRQSEEQATLITELSERLDAVHAEYRQKFGQLKETYEAKEKRRLSEMVASQSKQVEEYERRLLSMQQQLTMATDRHHTEIRQKDVDIESKLEKERNKIREQLEDDHRRETERLRFELDVTKRDYNEAESERQRLRETLASPNEEHVEAQKSWEERDVRQHQEISRLRQQMERLLNESSDKESRILELTMKMTERSKKHEERLDDMESQHAAVLIAREEVIAEQKRKLREADLAIKNERSRMDAELEDTNIRLETRIAELEMELVNATTSLERSEKSLRNAEASGQELATLTVELEALKSKIESERKSHESSDTELRVEIATLESKLHQSESTLQLKMAIIDEFETARRLESESHADNLRDAQQQIESLNQELSANQRLLASERAKTIEQTSDIVELARQKKELLAKYENELSRNCELSAKVDTLQLSLEELQSASKDLTVTNAEILESAQLKLAKERAAFETKIGELESNEKILRQENDELQESCDVIEANIRRLREVNDELEANARQLPIVLAERARLEISLSTKEEELMQSKTLLTQAAQELDEAHQKVKEYEKKLDQTKYLSTDLEKRALQASNVSDQYATTVKQLQATIEMEQKDKANLQEKLSSMQVLLGQQEQDLIRQSNLQEQVEQMSLSRDVLRQQVDDFKADLKLKATRISELEGQVEEATLSRTRERDERKSSAIKDLEGRIVEIEALATKRIVELKKVEFDLSERSKELVVLKERHAAATSKLEQHVTELRNSKLSADARLRALETELGTATERFEKQEKNILEIREREAQAGKLNEELRYKLRRAESELVASENRLNEVANIGNASAQLQNEVKQLTNVKISLESKIRDLQEEQEDREKHVRLAAERFSNQIVELQMQVENLTAAKTCLKTKLTEAEQELEQNAESFRSSCKKQSEELSCLHQRLAEQLEAKKQIALKAEALESQLASAEQVSHASAEKEESIDVLQKQVDSAEKENRSLKLRIGDVEQELDRKEKQIKEVVNRYSQEVAALSDKLECQTKERRNLQKEIDLLKDNAAASDASNETRTLMDRVESLEAAVDVERALTRDAEKAKKRLEKELTTVESSKMDLQERFEKVTSERNEVIAALEEVIHEVQSREDEIDALADALRRREEELEHARTIASKALSSAQEIKAKYKDRNFSPDIDRNVELEDQVALLTAALGQMKKNNNSLQRKLARLEEELTKKEGEYSELKARTQNPAKARSESKIGHYVSKSHPAEPPACTYNESASTAASTISGGTHALDSPSQSLGFAESMSDVGAGSDPWGMQPISTSSTDSSDNSASFTGLPAETGDKNSIERNALRKYVRKRYMSAKSTSNT